MSFFNTLDVAATGLSAQRIRINVISSNVANANNIDKGDGKGPYRKNNVIFQQVLEGKYKGGVKVVEVVSDSGDIKESQLRYEPGNKYADEFGMVVYPNINPVEEMVNLLEASRSYESNVTVLNTAKQLALLAIKIGSK